VCWRLWERVALGGPACTPLRTRTLPRLSVDGPGAHAIAGAAAGAGSPNLPAAHASDKRTHDWAPHPAPSSAGSITPHGEQDEGRIRAGDGAGITRVKLKSRQSPG